MNIQELVKDIVVDQLGLIEEDVSMDSKLVEDLGADSLDIVEIVMSLEEEFDITISDDDTHKFCEMTIEDIIPFIDTLKAK